MNLISLIGQKSIDLLRRLRYKHRRKVAFLAYAAATILGYTTALVVRFEFTWPVSYTRLFLLTLPVLLLVRHSTHLFFRLTTSRWRFVGVQDVIRLTGAALVGTTIFFLFNQLLPGTKIPRSVIAIEGLLNIFFTSAVWILYRVTFETARHRRASGGSGGRRVLIIGAGEAGYMLAREMLRSATGYRPVGFLDDDPHKWGTRLAGIEVIGSTDDLPSICADYRVDEIILVVPQATPSQLRVLVEKCAAVDLPYRVLPSIAEVFAGNVRLDQIREVRIEDLLGRDPIQLDLLQLAQDLGGGCALITGAAGSIGSELARQIARHLPDVLVLFDQAETELFFLDNELREKHPDLKIIPIVGDVGNRSSVEAVFRAYGPTHVLHAAAYKHVPMMELNVREAIRNNVLGSHVIGDAAGRYGAHKFVLVSTDKAVKPRSVMGASKRLAEILTLELQEEYPDTNYAAVRFGNVLGSNGSVIPVFKRQLAAGQPLTVTHPDATRYFMTITEAVQLILKASLLPEIRGHIAMLEMGEPVKILDLAENLLRLSGTHETDGIVFSGLRPGEKLHEELVAPDEETVQTAVKKVRLIKHGGVSFNPVLDELPEWEAALETGRDLELLAALEKRFPELAGAESRLMRVPGVATTSNPDYETGDAPRRTSEQHNADVIRMKSDDFPPVRRVR